jgi:hypothetical protein
MRRDVVYRHNNLIQDFQARVTAQDSTPTAIQELADENRQLKTEIDELSCELRREQARDRTMQMITAELSLELEQAKGRTRGPRWSDSAPTSCCETLGRDSAYPSAGVELPADVGGFGGGGCSSRDRNLGAATREFGWAVAARRLAEVRYPASFSR